MKAFKMRLNNYAIKIVFISILLYTLIETLYNYFCWPEENHWLVRLISGFIFLVTADVLYRLHYKGKIDWKYIAFLIPTMLMLGEFTVIFIVGGDPMFYWLLLCCSIICLIHMNSRAMLFYILLSNLITAVVFYIFNFPLLGSATSLNHQNMQFIIFNIISWILYSVSHYFISFINRFDVTARTFDTYMETTPGYMVVINENARVEFISRSLTALFGIPAVKYALDRPLLDLCPTFDIKMLFQEVMESGTFVEKHIDIFFNDKIHSFLLRSSLMNEDGISRTFEMMDITPVIEAMNEAESATRAKSDFLASMSHEIRTPLNAIVGMTELLMKKPLDNDQYSQAISIKAASMSLMNIINDILDFSKIDARKMDLIVEPFDFSSFIYDTVNMINIKANSAGLSFTTHLSRNIPPMINSDELRIKQALINILSNAVKFTGEGRISLHVHAERTKANCKLCFKVTDTGRGIRAEDIGKLFGEFQQFDFKKNRAIVGTGLGLAITKRLVEMMGGEISVESVYQKGSTFSFYIMCDGFHGGNLLDLPNPEQYRVLCYEPNPYYADAMKEMFADLQVKADIIHSLDELKNYIDNEGYTHIFFDVSASAMIDIDAKPDKTTYICIKEVSELIGASRANQFLKRPILISAVAHMLKGSVPSLYFNNDEISLGDFSTEGVRILVVDDNPINLMVAEGLLWQYGIEVVTALSGEESLVKVQDSTFDLVFMDHMMPEMDGLEATEAIRALGGEYAALPIIALSANAIVGAKDLFLISGMNDFLPKPIVIKELHSILLKYLPKEKVKDEKK